MNILFITADQWRGECLSCLDHPIVKTPHLDALASEGVLFRNHFAQAVPCAPSRTSMHTGMYMFNHRCVSNGTPLSSRFSNWALEVSKAGYAPSLFGYTDTALDPTDIHPDDDRLKHYSEPLPGMVHFTPIRDEVSVDWVSYLERKGYPIPARWWHLYGDTKPGVPWHQGGEAPLALAIDAQDHETHYMVDQCIDWIEKQTESWITHLSLLRPHPPFVAPEPYHALYKPGRLRTPCRHQDRQTQAGQHPFLEYFLEHSNHSWRGSDKQLEEATASYFGLMTEVDDNLGRLFEYLTKTNAWNETLIIFTSDHGEQLGDHWLTGKLGFYDQSFHVPLIIRDPDSRADVTRGAQIDLFTENIDLMPTVLDRLSLEIPSQCDGFSLMPIIMGQQNPQDWRSEIHWEYDFRDVVDQHPETTLGVSSNRCGLAVVRDDRYKYVYFAALPPLLFDLRSDPGELINLATRSEYKDVVLEYAHKLLSWRMAHTERGLTDTLLTPSGPVVVPLKL
jgi:arylsulfatase A-like enzyme